MSSHAAGSGPNRVRRVDAWDRHARTAAIQYAAQQAAAERYERFDRTMQRLNRLLDVSLAVLHHVVAFAPLIFIGSLYALSWREEAIIGHWPRLLGDDPKHVAMDDWLSYVLYESVFVFMLVSVLGVVLLTPLTWWAVVRNHRSKRRLLWTVLLVAAFIAGLLLHRADPERRWTWYMD